MFRIMILSFILISVECAFSPCMVDCYHDWDDDQYDLMQCIMSCDDTFDTFRTIRKYANYFHVYDMFYIDSFDACPCLTLKRNFTDYACQCGNIVQFFDKKFGFQSLYFDHHPHVVCKFPKHMFIFEFPVIIMDGCMDVTNDMLQILLLEPDYKLVF